MCKDLQDSDQPLTEIFEVHIHQESEKQEWSLRTIWRHWYLINSGITTLVNLNSVDFFVTPVWNTFKGAYPILRVLWRMKIFVIAWKKIVQPIFARAEQYAELGSSQQCEHANKEVTLRAPKSHHYGNSESLDFRVHATAAFVNEGRSYISQVT